VFFRKLDEQTEDGQHSLAYVTVGRLSGGGDLVEVAAAVPSGIGHFHCWEPALKQKVIVSYPALIPSVGSTR
jgi:hypothetical protein